MKDDSAVTVRMEPLAEAKKIPSTFSVEKKKTWKLVKPHECTT